jgi:hypothetical protein
LRIINKDKFKKLLQHFNDSIILDKKEQKHSILKYSLNPTLKLALEEMKIDYQGKEFKINTNVVFKSKIYRTLIRSQKIKKSNSPIAYNLFLATVEKIFRRDMRNKIKLSN